MQTIKIVGISGIGKTTLIEKVISLMPEIRHMSFGQYLDQYGDEANIKWSEDLTPLNDKLVLIDEHLEIGTNDLFDIYKEEDTVAICFLEESAEEIIKRRRQDKNRQRCLDESVVMDEQLKSKRRAIDLARRLSAPFILIKDSSLEKSVEVLINIINNVQNKTSLLDEQRRLNLRVVKIDTDALWHSHWLINKLRAEVADLVDKKMISSDIPFDSQDLEHQALFYLTTISPGKITSSDIVSAVEDQYAIVRDRLLRAMSHDELSYLFRGLKKFYPDLNVAYRLKLVREKGQLYAVGDGRKFEVEFKVADTSDKTIKLFTETLHYIHQGRDSGDIFAFYFKGDKYPWAIETAEFGKLARIYKRKALLAHGINPDKAVELTRMYNLPGSPLNSVSMMDALVRRYYRQKGMEALFTRTMPTYSKTKATTIAGGLDKVLCLKELRHYFTPIKIDNRVVWQATTKRSLEKSGYSGEVKSTHPTFELLPAMDVFDVIIRKSTLEPLPELKDGVIYFKD
ncbi:hypothetical protein HYT45_02300 [Candidatus Uhrbacteria bacterium]|nr:hypothetical protein [Candidatus Uhrbacteria bacterium]